MISGTNWYGRGTTDIRPRFASRLSKTKTIHKTIADYVRYSVHHFALQL
jgi:hypothetical protein